MSPSASASAAARRPSRPVDRLAERCDLARPPRTPAGARRACGRCGRRRRGARAPGSRSPAPASATPARSSIWARSNGTSRPRWISTARESCSAAVSASPSSSAVSPIACASARERVRVPVAEAMRVSASAQACAPARSPRRARKPAAQLQAPDRVVVVLAVLPALEQRAAVLERPRRGRPRPRRRRPAPAVVSTHMLKCPTGADVASDEASSRRAEPSLPWKPWIGAEQALGDPDRGVRWRSARGSAPRRATTRRARAARRRGRSRRPTSVPGSPSTWHSPSASSSASSARAVVGRVVEHHAEALVELGGDHGEVVLERQREPAADDLEARRRSRPAWPRATPSMPSARARRSSRSARSASSRGATWRARWPRCAWRRCACWLAIASRSTAASAGRPSAANASAAARRAANAALAVALAARRPPRAGAGRRRTPALARRRRGSRRARATRVAASASSPASSAQRGVALERPDALDRAPRRRATARAPGAPRSAASR